MSRGRIVGLSASPSEAPRTRTRTGLLVELGGIKWNYRDGLVSVSLDFEPAAAVLDAGMLKAFRSTLLWYVENASPQHLMNMYSRFMHLLRFIAEHKPLPVTAISSVDILNYKASLSGDMGWYVGHVAGFIKRWERLGYDGVGEAVPVLKELRLGGNKKGVAVLTMDPLKGPFTSMELEAIQAALDHAYSDGSIDEGRYLLAWLFIALGQRPAQFAALKVCDVRSGVSKDGDTVYCLRVPRAKQRNQPPRTTFKERLLVSLLGEPLLRYARRVEASFAGLLDDPKQAPLFPIIVPGQMELGFEYHHTSHSLASSLKNALLGLQVYSERTGELLAITPLRFRRTFGTRAAQEGHGELVIAELLDHTDTQSVGVYVAAVPEIAERIDRAVAMELAPLAQAFKGVLIADESEATRSGDPASRIVDLRIDRSAKPMGSCGQHSFCGFSAPVACYTCQSFEPWLDGPHEAVLTHLIAKRDQLLAATDVRMAAVNDRTILAVAQVIQLCQVERERRQATNG